MRSVIAAFLLVAMLCIPAAIAMYSYSQLQHRVVLLDQNPMKLGGSAHIANQTDLNLNGKYDTVVTGDVGGAGCCIDFYIYWDSWSTNPGMGSSPVMVHLNSSVVSSQSVPGRFSFVPLASGGYSMVFVNDEYPNTSNASVHANIILRYNSLAMLYTMLTALTILLLGFVSLTLFRYVEGQNTRPL
jgi:hypothetical protein